MNFWREAMRGVDSAAEAIGAICFGFTVAVLTIAVVAVSIR